MRLGANHVLVLDVTGRKWWHDYYNKPLDTPENWAVPNDDHKFCLMPSSLQELSPRDRLGGIVKNIIGVSIRSQTKALGPLYPVFRYAKAKAGEIVALEIITYGFLHPDFIYALLEMGKDDARYYFRG